MMRMLPCARFQSKTRSRSPFSRAIYLAATPLAMLFTIGIPTTPVAATPNRQEPNLSSKAGITPTPQPFLEKSNNDYQLCAAQLLRVRISPEAVADACAASLYPRDLTICVVRINRETNIAAADALSRCRQVRRPRDLATCAINISTRTQGSAGAEVLDNCRRSLLPVSFAKCVVGLNREIDFSVERAMSACIDGSDQPREFYPPNLVPVNQ